AVQAALGQQMIAGRQHREERRADRRHAARGDQRGLGSLEVGELGVQRQVVRRVVEAQIAHVVVTLLAPVLEGGRLEDRHLHRAVDARPRLSGVHQLGLEALVAAGHRGLLQEAMTTLSRDYATVSLRLYGEARGGTATRTVLPCRQYSGSRGGQSTMTRPTERFSSRVDNYARYRPSYPPPAIALLRERCGLGRGAVAADVGSGTGIL